jgi:phosphomannomutase/phosphoglucomutase
VAVDCGSGVASVVAPKLFAELGCEVLPLWCELDADFPGHWPDPVKPENLAELRRLVREKEADLGVAFDGDGDRLGVIDDQGEILWGDMIMILFWREILARHPGAKAIVEVKCSQALVDEIRRLGGDPLFYRTGHSLIKAKMREIGALFSGEMSGHMFFADEYYGFDDGIYAAARLLRILAAADRPLSALLADRPRYHATPEVRLDCPDETKFGVVDRVRRHFAEEGLEVIDIDGARVLFPEGWALVRASNTQPAIVVRCEARTAEGLEQLKATTAEALAGLAGDSGLTMPDW